MSAHLSELQVLERLETGESRRLLYITSLLQIAFHTKFGLTHTPAENVVRKMLDDCTMRGYAEKTTLHKVERWRLTEAGKERRKELVRQQLRTRRN